MPLRQHTSSAGRLLSNPRRDIQRLGGVTPFGLPGLANPPERWRVLDDDAGACVGEWDGHIGNRAAAVALYYPKGDGIEMMARAVICCYGCAK
jgi:hypothetical protein